jgi:hypothetical protein
METGLPLQPIEKKSTLLAAYKACGSDAERERLVDEIIAAHEWLAHRAAHAVQLPMTEDRQDLVQEGRILLWKLVSRFEEQRGDFVHFASKSLRRRVVYLLPAYERWYHLSWSPIIPRHVRSHAATPETIVAATAVIVEFVRRLRAREESARNRAIVLKHFGLFDGVPWSQGDIGRAIRPPITEVRVQQIVSALLHKLKLSAERVRIFAEAAEYVPGIYPRLRHACGLDDATLFDPRIFA